ncbi:SVBP protein, partial [Crypturellus soui]|nr:SVBP protein [Crypturellus soui]
MEPSGGRKEKPKGKEAAARLEKAKQKSAQQELKQRQRAEVRGRRRARGERHLLPLPRLLLPAQIYALNRVMTELEQQQFDSFCKQMQASGE